MSEKRHKGPCFRDGTPRISSVRERALWRDGWNDGYAKGVKAGFRNGKAEIRRQFRKKAGAQ